MRLVVARVEALAGDAVVRRSVPPDERFPDVIVREVAVLVVRRVEVGEIDLRQDVDELEGVASDRSSGAGQEIWHAQRDVVVCAGRPLLQVGHLQSGGRIDSVGREHEGGQQTGWSALSRCRSSIASRIASTRAPFLGWKYLDCHTERLGEVAGLAGQRVQLVDGVRKRVFVDRCRVGGDVTLREHPGVGRGVDRRHRDAAALELLGNPRRPGEEVKRRRGADRGRDLTEDADQQPFRTEVLDHRVSSTRATA